MARLEYPVIGPLVGPTSTLRFATAAAFFAFNGILLNAFARNEGKGAWAWTVLFWAVLGNFAIWLIEYRTRNAHSGLMKRGNTLEQVLGITAGVYTAQRTRGCFPLGHGILLLIVYGLAVLFWVGAILLAFGHFQLG